jgi:hypothetical protein
VPYDYKVNHTTPTMFIATFADGYVRRIMTKKGTLNAAIAYAQQLEDWFASGNYPGRTLLNVEPAKR